MRVFISHSSKDKESHVRPIVNWLGKDNVIYDEFSFEEGEKNLDEIISGLNESDIFLLLISDNSLDSRWVRKEITEASQLEQIGVINKILPIIIDKDITYDDPRIPKWMSESYNLQYVGSSKIIARRVTNKINDLIWHRYPKIKALHDIYVGRNEEINDFEKRIFDFKRIKPIAIFCSGINGVGRRSFLHKASLKTKITNSPHRPPSITLNRDDSIEDFIIKLNELGFTDLEDQIHSLSIKDIKSKINLVCNIVKSASDARERIWIVDEGCLVNYKREVSSWFQLILSKLENLNTTFFIASIYAVHPRNRPRNDLIHFIDLYELSEDERQWLFVQLLETTGDSLSHDKILAVLSLVSGIPEHVRYAHRIISETSRYKFDDKLYLINDYTREKASLILKEYHENTEALDLIRLIAQFDMISTSFLSQIVDIKKFNDLIDDFSARNIIEFMGLDNEIIKMNDLIRSYMVRNRLHIRDDYANAIASYVERIVNEDDLLHLDSTKYTYAIKEILKSGGKIDTKYIIPSHYLKCMKDIYHNHGDMTQVIKLAYTALQKKDFMLPEIVQDIRYYLCLALARNKDKKMLSEVQEIHGDEHDFLLGFYYRRVGKYSDALRVLLKIQDAPYVGARAKRELVQVHLYLEEYDDALMLAERNYNNNISNQFHIQAYFNCLIYSKHAHSKKETLSKLIDEFSEIDSEQAREMGVISQSLFLAKIESKFSDALQLIKTCKIKFPKSHYPLLTWCDIGLMCNNIEEMNIAVAELERLGKNNVSSRTLNKYKAYTLALDGNVDKAIKIISADINSFPDKSRERWIQKLHEISRPNASVK